MRFIIPLLVLMLFLARYLDLSFVLADDAEDKHKDGSEWSYTNQNSWSNKYPQCRGMNMRQSPIDIVTDTVMLKVDARLEFINWNQKVEFQYKNTHHSISVLPIPSAAKPSVRVSWLNGAFYELQEIHFHWGDGVNKGSEHEINGERAAAEMHMVHYKRGVGKEDIGNVENSVLVIGVLIESDTLEHNKLESLVDSASHINGTNTEYVCDNPHSLINLLPDHYNSFYIYNGSLTTPPCYEVVTWVVMSQPVYMSHERLVELSNIEAENPNGRVKISSNHRDVQPLLHRPVYVSFNISTSLTIETNYDVRFKSAFDNYWKHIGNSVRQALSTVRTARESVLSKLGTFKG